MSTSNRGKKLQVNKEPKMGKVHVQIMEGLNIRLKIMAFIHHTCLWPKLIIKESYAKSNSSFCTIKITFTQGA